MNIKKISVLLTFVMAFFLSASAALAHVTVKPGQVGVGQRLNFVVSVPTEEDVPTIGVRLVIPEGVQSVRPNVKPGWTIQLKKIGEGEESRVSEIIWTGGRIPAEQRDEFTFSAQAPNSEGSISWKAYQTYGDGTIVAWENDPKVVEEYTKNNPPQHGMEHDDHDAPRPYSTTKVVNDLVQTEATSETKTNTKSGNTLSIVVITLSIVAISAAYRKKS